MPPNFSMAPLTPDKLIQTLLLTLENEFLKSEKLMSELFILTALPRDF